MALVVEDTDQFWPSPNYASGGSIKLGTNTLLSHLTDLGDLDVVGKIIEYNGSVITVGADQSLIAALHSVHVNNLGTATDRAIMAESDTTSTDLNLYVLSISGTTITVGTKETADIITPLAGQFAVGMNTTGDKGLLFYRDGALDSWLVRFTVSGTTVTAGTPQAYVGSSQDFLAYSMIGLDGNRVLMAGHNLTSGKYAVQVVNISSGITEGTLSDTDQNSHTGNPGFRNLLSLLETDKVILVLPLNNSVKVRVVNISGTSISSYGSDLDLYPSTISTHWASIDAVNSSNVILYHSVTDSGLKPRVETLSVSGDTVTENGDEINLTPANQTGGRGRAISVATDIAIVIYAGTGPTGEAQAISGVPGAPAGTLGQFYFGAGTLVEKFTLPFSGVAPKGMTLDKSLGTVVIGSKTEATIPIIYSNHPYPTGIATSEAFPTGTYISAIRWI